MPRPLVQHDGSIGQGYALFNPTYGSEVKLASIPEYLDIFPRDVIVALPGQVTTIKARFDKPGRFNW